MAVASALLLEGPVWLALGILWIYNICIMLDSGALTAGTVTAAAEDERGALLAVHSMIGFMAVPLAARRWASCWIWAATAQPMAGSWLYWLWVSGQPLLPSFNGALA